MARRIEQHSPPRVRLLWQCGAKHDRPLTSRAEIVGGQIKVHDRRPRPVRGNMTVNLLRNQHSPGTPIATLDSFAHNWRPPSSPR